MRVTFGSVHRTALETIDRAATDLARKQREVASGRRLHTAGDDPSAAAAAVRTRSEIATLDQYGRAAGSVLSRLSVVDTILGDIVSGLTGALTAAAAGSGSEASTAQRESAATQLEASRDALFTDMITQYRGSYVFAGGAITTAPYTQAPDGTVSAYAGDANVVSVDVDRQLAVQVTFEGGAIMQGGDPDDVFTVLDDLATAVRAGDTAAIDAGRAALESAFDRAVAAQAQLGNDLRAVELQLVRLDTSRRNEQTILSRHEDVNMLEAITGLSVSQTAYQAALTAVSNLSRPLLLDFLR